MKRCGLGLAACGACRHPEIATRLGGSLRPVEFPSLVGLVEHPDEGLVLFDTGYDPAFFAATEPFPERLYRWTTPVRLRERDTAAAWLRRLGHKPEDVRTVVLSHFHGDHMAGLHQFPAARLFCSRAGRTTLRRHGRLGRVRRGLLDALVPRDLDARSTWFEDCSRVALPSAYSPFAQAADLFGDGSLLAVELPGHCPGHWGLALRLPDDRDVLLAADAAWSMTAVERNDPPPRLTTALMGATAPYRATLNRLHALHRANPDLLILPSHCAVAMKRSGLVCDAGP